ncbi:hypothetical protein [Streptomyces sp. NPDC096153]|uniref:hypothetical protein n=1 Tax=Streptomyces sp. NPDC096153 TaxID=3155548 RepID=UPI0033191A7A
MTNTDDQCARDGCTFHVELVPIGEGVLPGMFCGPACADFVWVERALTDAEPTPELATALEGLEGLRRLLNGRRHPSDIGPLPGVFDG